MSNVERETLIGRIHSDGSGDACMRKRQYRSPLGLESTVVQMRPEKSASPFALSRKAIFVGAATLAVALSATAALAQNCGAIAVTIPAAAPRRSIP